MKWFLIREGYLGNIFQRPQISQTKIKYLQCGMWPWVLFRRLQVIHVSAYAGTHCICLFQWKVVSLHLYWLVFTPFHSRKKSANPVPFVAGTRQHVGALSWVKIQTENTVSWRACGLLGFIFKGWGQGRLLLREAESGKIYSWDLDHA